MANFMTARDSVLDSIVGGEGKRRPPSRTKKSSFNGTINPTMSVDTPPLDLSSNPVFGLSLPDNPISINTPIPTNISPIGLATGDPVRQSFNFGNQPTITSPQPVDPVVPDFDPNIINNILPFLLRMLSGPNFRRGLF